MTGVEHKEKFVQDLVESLQAQPGGQGVSAQDIEVVTSDRHAPQTHPDLYERIQGILADVNNAIPDADIDMPNIVIVENSPVDVAYNHAHDTIVLDKESLESKSDKVLNAVIAHELGHKAGFKLGIGGHSPDAENDNRFNVFKTTRDSCAEDQKNHVFSRFFEENEVGDIEINPTGLGLTRDDVESNMIDNGASPECASAVADALQKYSDAQKAQEYFSDMVAVKAGYGEGILEDVQDTVNSHFHSGVDKLDSHISNEERADNLMVLMDAEKAKADVESGFSLDGIMDSFSNMFGGDDTRQAPAAAPPLKL